MMTEQELDDFVTAQIDKNYTGKGGGSPMWVRSNPNPKRKEVPDCVVRAIAIAMNRRWYDVYDDLYRIGREECNMPNSDEVWGKYLYRLGFEPFLLPESCPQCVTVKMFCHIFRQGVYIIGTGYHAVAVINGDYYDSGDSGSMMPSFFWRLR